MQITSIYSNTWFPVITPRSSKTLFPAKQRIKTLSSTNCISTKSTILQTDHRDDLAMVTLDSMQRANSTLEEVCRSYFMFHEMDDNTPESLFKYLPLLSFSESYIYQLDTIHEKKVHSSFGGTSFSKLEVLLGDYGMLTDRLKQQLKGLDEFWALERKLCRALIRKQEIQLEDVMKANHLRSSDFRFLNILLYQLNGKEVNETHMEFLSVAEFIGEISDDMIDYETDVLENTFNMLRMFVGIYGASSAQTMLAKTIREAEEKYGYLLSTLDPHLALKFQKTTEEAAKKDGMILGYPLGPKWSMPPIIKDEDLYRSEISNTRPPEEASFHHRVQSVILT